ncbi:MAG TPA: basic amino acid ABC transporter substrate-binding protein [Solirubrobacterales bacterium]|nr:basic amino acid ABC transporter substrate-binding protein [Solirubrobacterales bacterium]
MERKTKAWALIALLAGLVAAFAVSGCGDDDSTTGGDETGAASDLPLISPGTLTVGSDIPYPPFEQGRPPDYEGFDIDLITAVAEKMGLDTKIVDLPFNVILTGGGGQFDLAIAATTITPARAKKVDFSDPYFNASQGLLVQEGSDVQSVDDLAGKIVGAQDGTTGETYAEDNTDAAEVRPFPQIDQAYNALKVGQVDAVLNDLPSVNEAAEQLDGLEVVEDFPTDEQYGIVLPKGQTALLDAVNSALQEVKDDGTLTELYQEWFSVDPPEELLQAGPAAALGGGEGAASTDSTTGG